MAKHVLIVQKIDDAVYVYTESLAHHATVQEKAEMNERLAKNRVPFSVFEGECLVEAALENGQWTSALIDIED